jgi:hypothetical protein
MAAATSGLGEWIETHRRADALNPERQQRVSETLHTILDRLGLKGAGEIKETLQMGAAMGWPSLTETVSFESADARNAGAVRLQEAFLAVNPADMSFGVHSVTPGGGGRPTYTFHFRAQGEGHMAYAHELYETMETSLKAIQAKLAL